MTNHQIRLAARPVGLPKPSDWKPTEEPTPEPGDGQMLVQLEYISLDPAMRGWMNEGRSYVPGVNLGDVMRAYGAGKVIASKNPGFAVGDHVAGVFGAQEYAISDGRSVAKLDVGIAPIPVWLGALGMTGLTAYFGLLDVGKPEPGQTVVVSGAAGAVGSIAGQIAKIKGCRAVGIAGGPEKCRELVETFGFDAAIDYKQGDIKPALRQHCPKGVDVYFDNVGGDTLDAVLANLAFHARIVICGAISQYNSTEGVKGPSNYLALLVARATMTGMVVFDWAARYGEATRELVGWYKAGKLVSREHVVDGGIAKFPDARLMLYRGDNRGKLVLRVAS
jgi:NADPH-dependent curcumin reductase CurA